MEHADREEEWIEALRTGNEKGFEQIYQKYWTKLFSVAYNYTRSRETSQEIVQEIFVSLWVNRETLKAQATLQAYLFGAIRNKIYDHLDKQAVRSKHQLFISQQQTAAANVTEQHVAYSELQELVQEQIQSLPDTTRQVFQLSRVNGSSIPEIATELQVSVKTVEYHLTKALKHLRLRLGQLWFVLTLLTSLF